MQIRKFILPVIIPSFKTVLGRLGYNKKRTELSDSSLQIISQCLEYSGNFIHPVGNTIDDVITEKSGDLVRIDYGIEFQSKKLAEILINSRFLTMMTCTIGNNLKEEINRLEAGGDLTRAVVLDAIASEAIESFADYITEVLKREKGIQGFKAAMRFSPGYGDLKTEIHAEMLPILDSESIGISYNKDNFILYPEKSISAIIGWEK